MRSGPRPQAPLRDACRRWATVCAGAALLALLAPACRASFRFDDPEDAGTTPDLASSLAADVGKGSVDLAPSLAPDASTATGGVDGPGFGPDTPAPIESVADAAALGPAVCSDTDLTCSCVSDQCSCQSGQMCWFSGPGCDVVGGHCGLSCDNQSRCEGSCLHSCQLDCSGGSTCRLTMRDNATVIADGAGTLATVTVGRGSQVKCVHGATCHVTCSGPCVLQCMTGATCDLRCPSDDQAGVSRPANNGGTCSDY